MNTKPLYLLIQNCGWGSSYPRFTFNSELIAKFQRAADEDRMDYENGIGMDGDGFHYETLNVPEDCSALSLGISLLGDDAADEFGSVE
jgi:hypothetical protein